MDALTPNQRKDLARDGAKRLNNSMTPIERVARAKTASEAALTMRRLRKLVEVTDAEAEGWKEPEWIE